MKQAYIATSKGPISIIEFNSVKEADSYCDGDKWKKLGDQFGGIELMFDQFSLINQLCSKGAFCGADLPVGPEGVVMGTPSINDIAYNAALLHPKDHEWKVKECFKELKHPALDPDFYPYDESENIFIECPPDKYYYLSCDGVIAARQSVFDTIVPSQVFKCGMTFLYPRDKDTFDVKYAVGIIRHVTEVFTGSAVYKVPPSLYVNHMSWHLVGIYDNFYIGVVINHKDIDYESRLNFDDKDGPVFTWGQFQVPHDVKEYGSMWKTESKWGGYGKSVAWIYAIPYFQGYDFKKGLDKMFQPRIATRGVGIYKMTKEEVQNFFISLWHTTFLEFVEKFFGNTQDGILTLKWFYGINKSIPEAKKRLIKIGNTKLDDTTGSAVLGVACKDEFINYIIDNIAIARVHNNYLDFAPYTQVSIFIPFYGYVDIDPAACVGGWVRLVYDISLFTGIASVKIYTRRASNEEFVLYNVVTAQMSVDIPINAHGVNDLGARIASGLITAGSAIAGGAAGGVGLGAAVGQGVQSAISAATSNSVRAGGLAPEVSILSGMRVKVLITTVTEKRDLSAVVGKPDYSSKKIGDCDGFIKVLKINDTRGGCKYDKDIEELLKGGVFK